MEQEGLWGVATIIGPIVLLVLFIWVILRNRSSKVSKDVTERATKANYAAEDRISKEEGREHDAKVQAHKDEFKAQRDNARTDRDETL